MSNLQNCYSDESLCTQPLVSVSLLPFFFLLDSLQQGEKLMKRICR